MKNRLLQLLVLFLLVLGAGRSAVFAQADFRPGYIITNTGETVQGLIDYRMDGRSQRLCTFKKDASAAPVDYGPGDIQAWQIIGYKLFESKVVPQDTVGGENMSLFLEVLVKGKASLYFNSLNSRFYVGKGGDLYGLTNRKYLKMDEKDGRTYQVSPKVYVGILLVVLGDCGELKKEIQAVKLLPSSLVKIVQQYNSCGSSRAASQIIIPTVRFQVSLLAGHTQSTLYLQTESFQGYRKSFSHFTPSYGYTFGLGLTTVLPRLIDRISFQTEAFYEGHRYVGYYEKEGYVTFREDTEIEIEYLKMPLLLRYTHTFGKFSPFVNAGAATSLLLKQKNLALSEWESQGVVESAQEQLFPMRKTQQFLIVGAGARFHLDRKRSVLLEVRHERGNSLDDTAPMVADNVTRTKGVTALVGFTF